ncbi:MAG: hypothetical protein DSY42_01140 [Aquifex sp.]|nr:MAG: hypothetical protein DSY42_01140 [Aquifex sp.]
MKAGIDFGFGQVKFYTESGKGKFPTEVKEFRKTSFVSIQKRTVSYGGKEYFVGEEAQSYSKGIPIVIADVERLIEYVPVFCRYLAMKGVKATEVVTGLPPSHMNLKEEMRKKVAEGFSVPEENVSVVPQGSGILLDVEDKVEDFILVLDVGFNTLDYVVARRGNPQLGEAEFEIEEAGSFHRLGTYSLIKEVESLFAGEFPELNTLLTYHDLAKVVRERKLKIGGKEYDLSEIVDRAREAYEIKLQGAIMRLLDEIKRCNTLVVGGGGAYLLEEEFLRSLHPNVVVPEEPDLSQARGYYKLLEE